MSTSLPVIASSISTFLFVVSALPMLTMAFRTMDLRSYGLGNIAVTNAGNVVHSLCAFSLPAGPIWLLHGFYLVTYGLMLAWYLRYGHGERRRTTQVTTGTLVTNCPKDREFVPFRPGIGLATLEGVDSRIHLGRPNRCPPFHRLAHPSGHAFPQSTG